MRIHILGICGTFMAGLAILARARGHTVSGADMNVYPPMSTQLMEAGITLNEGYDPSHLEPAPDLVIIGNALSRGNPSVERILNDCLPYTSGPQWLWDEILQGREVLAVSGTHGKTTTTSMLAWVLEAAGMAPGFLVGGIPANFDCSARLGQGRHFVVEADEYDTAFFDKRSKFIHYHPKTLIINNIEFDHADIFVDLAAIRREFHHMVRTLPSQGLILAQQGDDEIRKVLAAGCWTPVEYFGDTGGRWTVSPVKEDYSIFTVLRDGIETGNVQWGLVGRHNAHNALAAAAAAVHAGVAPEAACTALCDFTGVKRRLEKLATIRGVTLYDDFAHHPTEIRATLTALRATVGVARILAIMEPRSNTMRMGVHQRTLADAFVLADRVLFYQPDDVEWDLDGCTATLDGKREVHDSIDGIVARVAGLAQSGDQVIIMSNGGFGGIQQRLMAALEGRP